MKNENKIAFDTEEEAREELERIINTTYKAWRSKDIKPCRYYKETDGKYYLTSKADITVYK